MNQNCIKNGKWIFEENRRCDKNVIIQIFLSLHNFISTLVKLENCMDATNPNWCSVCENGYVLFNGRCVDICPSDGYYVGKDNHQDSCIQCYYSCKTCDGPNDYQVKSRSTEKLEVWDLKAMWFW